MTVAEGLMHTGVAETVLVVGSEKMSAIVDWKDRSTCVLFGDGAGAAVLKRSKPHAREGILSAYMRSDGTLAELLWRPSGGAKIPFSETVLGDRSSYVRMAGGGGVEDPPAPGRGAGGPAPRGAQPPRAD